MNSNDPARAPRLDELCAEVRGAQDAILDVSALPPLIVERPAPRSRALLTWVPSLAAAAAIVALIVREPADHEAAALAPVDVTVRAGAALSAPGTVRFNDGSIVLVERGAAQLAVLEEDRARLTLQPHSALSLALPRATPAGPGWLVDAGPWRVEARGARVDAKWDGVTLAVRVGDGTARVTRTDAPPAASSSGSAPDALAVVAAGEERSFAELAPQPGATATQPSAIGVQPGAPATQPSGVTRSSTQPSTGATASAAGAAAGDVDVDGSGADAAEGAPGSDASRDALGPTWIELARDDRHSDALNAARALSGGVEGVVAAAASDELMVLATSARLAASPDVARLAYLAVRTRAPGTADAARAAYFLGVLAADRGGDVGEAAHFFALYRAEAPDGELAGEALGRVIELGRRAKRDVDNEAREYLRRWPDGPHAAIARKVLAE